MRNLIFFLNIQHKQEDRVSYYIHVIYVRGHVRHNDKLGQSAAFAMHRGPMCRWQTNILFLVGRCDHNHGKWLGATRRGDRIAEIKMLHEHERSKWQKYYSH